MSDNEGNFKLFSVTKLQVPMSLFQSPLYARVKQIIVIITGKFSQASLIFAS